MNGLILERMIVDALRNSGFEVITHKRLDHEAKIDVIVIIDGIAYAIQIKWGSGIKDTRPNVEHWYVQRLKERNNWKEIVAEVLHVNCGARPAYCNARKLASAITKKKPVVRINGFDWSELD